MSVCSELFLLTTGVSKHAKTDCRLKRALHSKYYGRWKNIEASQARVNNIGQYYVSYDLLRFLPRSSLGDCE